MTAKDEHGDAEPRGAAALLHETGPIINIGLPQFAVEMERQGAAVVDVDWSPPAGGEAALVALLEGLGQRHGDRIAAANAEAVARLVRAHPVLIDVRQAREVLPVFAAEGAGEDARVLLHAGPPVTWEAMCGPVRGAVLGAILYEGWARDLAAAEALAASGAVRFDPCHHHGAVGPMAGIISPSMWLWCVRDEASGGEGQPCREAYCTMNEGLGRVLRFGANGPEVIEHLRWMERTLGPLVQGAVRRAGRIDLRAIIAQALTMGDEGHNRNFAGTALFLRELTPHLIALEAERAEIIRVVEFIAGNGHFFLNLSMPACKVVCDGIRGLEACTLLAAMARNGTELGIQVAGLDGRWFTAPAGLPEGLYFPGFGPDDRNPDLGDSTICETGGIGAFAMACAPAIVKFVGGTPADAVARTLEMFEIAAGQHEQYLIPALDFRGAPLGIDVRRVVEMRTTPIINTGIAHREPGIGQIGAGILRAPMTCFVEALRALGEALDGASTP